MSEETLIRILIADDHPVVRQGLAAMIGRQPGMVISEGTVRAHVNNILSKMGASDRTQAATLAIKRGLVRLD